MLRRILSRDVTSLTYFFTASTHLSSDKNNSITKNGEHEETKSIIYDKPPVADDKTSSKKKVTRKQPFKYYFDDEERDKNKIVFYEEFFDQNTRKKDRDNFMNAIEAFRLTNPSKNLYIDFVYGALMKMKEYNSHTHLEAYRKLLELFPIGPLRSETPWQRENFHFPRHQSAALQIFEQLERNGLIIDEQMAALAIKIFGDWTHVVRKAKRQLYWLPKFKNANPYPVPSIQVLEGLSDFEIALAAIERITKCADRETKISAHYSKEFENDAKDTWILSAQSTKQKELLKVHKKEIPIFVEGPNFTWIRNKLVNYYVMKTDPLPETIKAHQDAANRNGDDFKEMHNLFSDPFKKNLNKNSEPSIHEQLDGIIYGVCVTETSSKISVNNWTKILEEDNRSLKEFVVVYRIKEKPGYIVVQDNKDQKNEEEKDQ